MTKGPGRPTKYPWKVWFDGNDHTLVMGRDFDLKMESMRVLILAKARLLGLDIRTAIAHSPETLTITMVKEESNG